jgi:restriction system protein
VIEDSAPVSWKDLQNRVAQILGECGIDTAVEKVVELACGKAEIDVWAHDASSTPPQTYIIECKRWTDPVPQTIVHAFRTVVGDSGANWGAIISSNGFQSGAYEAARYSNVRLLTWEEFQGLFVKSWFERFFCRVVGEKCDPLIEYTEPINSRIFRKADLLSEAQRDEFRRLRGAHGPFGGLCLMMRAHSIGALQLVLGDNASPPIPELPLRSALRNELDPSDAKLPDSVLDAASYRGLLSSILVHAQTAIETFDDLFGERA